MSANTDRPTDGLFRIVEPVDPDGFWDVEFSWGGLVEQVGMFDTRAEAVAFIRDQTR